MEKISIGKVTIWLLCFVSPASLHLLREAKPEQQQKNNKWDRGRSKGERETEKKITRHIKSIQKESEINNYLKWK